MNVAAIATDGTTPSGMIEGYYLIFDLIAVSLLLLYTVVLLRVLRTRRSGLAGRRWYRRLITVWRELLVPFVILIRLPDIFGEAWPTLIHGDVGLVAGLVAMLGLTTFAARAAFAYRSASAARTRSDPAPEQRNATVAGVTR
jgi:hypothetical protein